MEEAELLQRFAAFAREATTLVAVEDTPAATVSLGSVALDGFADFVRSATPIATSRLLELVARLAPHATLKRFTGGADILQVAGLTGAEDPYTELVAWALGRDLDPASTLRRQRAWLATLPFGHELELTAPAEVLTQVSTNDGVPDLVLRSSAWSVVVEAKTWTEEHPTPSGRMQTVAYPDAIREAWELEASHRIYVVYLTPNGRPAKNPDAALSTYARLAAALAEVIEAEPLPARVQPAIELLIAHWLRLPLQTEGSLSTFFDHAEAWVRDARIRPETLLPHVADIEAACRAFLPGESHDVVPIQ